MMHTPTSQFVVPHSCGAFARLLLWVLLLGCFAPLAQANPEVLIYLIAGQSNADGRAPGTGLPTSPVNLQSPQVDVPIFYRTTRSATPVYETLRPGASGTVGAFGPEVTLGRALADWTAANSPTNRIALIKYAVGGTSLSSDWAAGGSAATTGDGAQYKTFQSVVTAGLAALNADASLNGYTKRIAGFVWVQGEADSLTAVQSASYEANLTAFLADVRLTYGSDLPFLLSKLSLNQTRYTTGTPEEAAGFAAVRAAQVAVATSVPRTFLIDTDSAQFPVLSDHIHFDAAGQQALGNAFAAAVIAAPAIVSQPQDATINSGETNTLSVAASGDSLTYEWYVGTSGNMSAPVSGATSSSFTTPPLSVMTSYWVRVTNAAGSVNSRTATLSIAGAIVAPSITVQPHSTTIGTGQTATLSVTATGTSHTYQWYVGTSGNTTAPISGATASSYTTPNLNATTSYWVRAHNASGDADSSTATVTLGTANWSAYHVQFFTGTPNANVTTGESASLKRLSDGTSSGVTATYSYAGTWQSSTAAATKNNPPANTDAAALFNGKADLGQATKTINANTAATATITFTGLDPAKKYSVALYAGYKSSSSSTAQTKFTLQNAGAFANGSTAGVGDCADGNDATVSYVSGDVNVTTNGYVARWTGITPTGTSGTSFSVLMERNAPGTAGAICAQAFMLEEYNPAAPTVAAQPEGVTIDNGATTVLSVLASGTGLAYQWYEGASGATAAPVSGATTATLATPALFATTSYWVRVSNSGGAVNSAAAFVSVRTPYETWAAAAGFAADEQTRDPDGDGLPNLLEFALGGNPNSASVAPLPTIDAPAPDTLGFTFHRATGSVSYIVESSITLAPGSWTPEYTFEKNTDPASVGQDFTVEVPFSGATKKFLRLRVVE